MSVRIPKASYSIGLLILLLPSCMLSMKGYPNVVLDLTNPIHATDRGFL